MRETEFTERDLAEQEAIYKFAGKYASLKGCWVEGEADYETTVTLWLAPRAKDGYLLIRSWMVGDEKFAVSVNHEGCLLDAMRWAMKKVKLHEVEA